MPTNKIQSLPLTITGITSNSISFKWDRVPGYTANPDPIIYEIELREAENPNDSWHIIKRGTQLYSFTFTGLKANTMYAFHVKAYDESRKVAQYPFDIASRTAKTLTADTQAPTVSNKTIKVTRITQTSIAIQWEPATDNQTAAKDIRYQVWFTQSSEPWRLVKDAKGITSHSFTGLKKGTTYAFYIKATDEAGNSLQYPLDNGCMAAKTLEAKADTNAPTVLSKKLDVVKVTENSISIQWEKAKDDLTLAKEIRYVVGLTEADNADDPWHIVDEAKDICEFTFKNLKANTKYAFYVMAFDEAGNVLQYPLDNGSMAAKTLEAKADTNAPTVLSKKLDVVKVTENSISIQWEKAKDDLTLAKEIRYVVGLTEADNADDPWHIVDEAKDICEFTFKNLKANTKYAFYVMAFDEAGNMTQYPLYNGSMAAKTNAGDTQAPTAENRTITVLEASGNQIIIRWEPATDNVTAAKDIRYQVWFKQSNSPSEPWRLFKEGKNITTCTFTGLKNKTKYAFFVKAFDEAGNVLQYPLDNGCMTATTDSANSRLLYWSRSVFCDGIYGPESKSNLRVDLGKIFNRNYFEISFDFYPLATDKDSVQLDNIITLDSSRRVFGVHMKNGILQATVNNSYSYPIDMGFRYSPNKWQTLRMVYDNGKLTVNGAITRQIGKLNDPGNNILSSMNFSNGHAFKGYIKDLIVKTK